MLNFVYHHFQLQYRTYAAPKNKGDGVVKKKLCMGGGGGYKRKKNMGYWVVFKKTHWFWGFEKVMKIIGGGGWGLDERKIIAGGGGLKLWAFQPLTPPPPPPPCIFKWNSPDAYHEIHHGGRFPLPACRFWSCWNWLDQSSWQCDVTRHLADLCSTNRDGRTGTGRPLEGGSGRARGGTTARAFRISFAGLQEKVKILRQY